MTGPMRGRLQLRDWTDRDGNKRRSAEIVVDNMYFGDSKRDGDNARSSGVPQGGYGQPSYGVQSGYGYQSGQALAYPSQAMSGYPSSDYGDFTDVEDDGNLPF